MSRVGRELRSARAALRRAYIEAFIWRLGWSMRYLIELGLMGFRCAWALRLPLRVGRGSWGVLRRAGLCLLRELLIVVRLPERPSGPHNLEPARQAAGTFGRLPSVESETGEMLQDLRVRRLQEKLVRMICGRYLGVLVGHADAGVLGAYVSVPWVLRNVYTAAGIGPDGLARGGAASLSECRRRCAVVFPTVVRLLAMDQGAAHGGIRTGGTRSGIGRSLYPQAVDVERYRRRAELVQATSRRSREAGFLAAELAALSAYDIALTLHMQLPDRHPGAPKRALHILEHIHSTRRRK